MPVELKAQPRWVCWRLVERGGRRTKMPVCAATGKMASSTDGATWCSFEAAVAACGKLGANGVGFVFGPDRAYTGLDLDHVLHDGVLDAEYRWVVDEADTYTEVRYVKISDTLRPPFSLYPTRRQDPLPPWPAQPASARSSRRTTPSPRPVSGCRSPSAASSGCTCAL